MGRFHFNNIRLRNKLLIIYIVSVFIPIILTNVIFYYVTTENVKSQKMHDLSLSLEQMSNEFSQGVDDAIGVSTVLYADNMLYSFLERQYTSLIDFILAYNSYFRDIDKYVPIYSSIHSITIYTDNETIIYAGGIHQINEQVKESHWYKNTDNLRGLFPVLTRTRGDSGQLNRFSLIRELNYFNNNTTQKIIKIELSPAMIEQTFNNVTFQGDVYLVNENGMIEYTTDPDVKWAERSYQFDSISIPKDSVILEEEYALQYVKDWKVIGVVSEYKLLEEIRNSRKFIFYLAIANFVVPSFVIIYITSSLHKRLSHILQHMRKMKEQNFELIEGINYEDEIGELTSEFNRMSNKIKVLINDVYIASIQKKDLELQRKQAQLSALQSQINPHFLFNVLETIRMRSFLKNEDETAKIIQNMARLLRTSITWGKDWITVREEVHLIQSFLEIQKYRFDDKIQYVIDVEESAYECIIPNMLLIPFVENASIHGIEPLKGKGTIKIKIRQQQNNLICTIKDSGVGIQKEKYEQLLHSLKEDKVIGDNIGIKNVYYRLKMYYGDQFDFTIESTNGTGTLVQITIPVKNH